MRARIDPSDGALYAQRVEAPSAESDFDVWTALGSVEAGAGLGLSAAGTRVLLATYEDSDVTVRESTDSGATFGVPSTVASAEGVTAVACATDADGRAMVAWAAGGAVSTVTRSSGGSGWGTPAAWGHDSALASVNALVASREPDWAILVTGVDAEGNAGAWSTNLGAGIGAPPGAWAALVPVILASPGTDVTYRASGILHAGVPRLLLVESYGGTGAFDQPMMATAIAGALYADGSWRDPLPLGLQAPYGLSGTTSGDSAFLASSDGVWHATMSSPETQVAPLVTALRYQATALPGGGPDGGEHLRFTLASEGEGDEDLAAAFAPGAEIAFRAGYVTDGGLEAPAGRVLWVTSVRREPGRLHVEAEGALGVLRRWRASRQITWDQGDRSVIGIAGAVARLGGFGVASAGPSATASTVKPAFTLRAGDNGATALARLFARTPDLLHTRGLQVIVREADPQATPAATFALAPYGDEHAILATARVDDRERVGWARVLGDGAAAQALDLAAIERGGGIALAVDETLDAAGETADRAQAEVRRAALVTERAWAEVVPHPGIEPSDVVALSAPSSGLDAAVMRVISVRLEYAARPRGRYVMRLGLGVV